MSRLIVKNLPKHLKEVDLATHFAAQGADVTDAKIMFKDERSRKFGFVGFKTEDQAKAAKEHFNKTFLHTSRIEVDFAKAQDDDALPRPWSKHSQGSSANTRMLKAKGKLVAGQKKALGSNVTVNAAEVEAKKVKFREFLKLAGQGAGTSKEKQSWNDQFNHYMHTGAVAGDSQDKKGRKGDDQETQGAAAAEGEGEERPEGEAAKAEEESLVDDKRLFVMNLSYKVTKDELQELFGKYGEIVDIEIPFRKHGKGVPLGLGFIRFTASEAAIQAFAELDKSYFQGRKIHIKPAERKPPAPIEEDKPYEFPPDHPEYKYQQEQLAAQRAENGEPPKQAAAAASQSNYKQEKEKILKTNFDDETNWNYLFMNQDTVATSMAKQLNQTKGEFFSTENGGSSMAVKMAKSETIIISQTKQWLKEMSIIDFDILDSLPRSECKRNKYVLLIKNLPYTAKEGELKELFERYGQIKRFLVSPFNTLAIAEFTEKSFAKAALKNLAYHKVNFVNPIYLEYAPKGLVKKQKAVQEEEKEGPADSDEEVANNGEDKEEVLERQQRQIFVKNLNFDTREEQLQQVFAEAKTGGQVKAVTIIRRSDSGLSRGYGFVEMSSPEAAKKAVKRLQNFLLDDHAMKLSLSTKAITESETQAKKDKVLKKRKAHEATPNEEAELDNEDVQSEKLLVKNLAFEATPDEVRELFQPFGHIKKVRLPKKVNSQNHRGFGFVEFATKDEARLAFRELKHTHLYSRKLVIEYAKQTESADQKVAQKKPKLK